MLLTYGVSVINSVTAQLAKAAVALHQRNIKPERLSPLGSLAEFR